MFKETHFRKKTYSQYMYSPNTIKNIKIVYLTWNFVGLSAVSDNADENTFSNFFAKLKSNLKIV